MVLLKFILMSVILVGMVVLLMSVRALRHPYVTADKDEAAAMRKDVEHNVAPITSRSVFNDFLSRDQRKKSRTLHDHR